jgi:hypothetical protein
MDKTHLIGVLFKYIKFRSLSPLRWTVSPFSARRGYEILSEGLKTCVKINKKFVDYRGRFYATSVGTNIGYREEGDGHQPPATGGDSHSLSRFRLLDSSV